MRSDIQTIGAFVELGKQLRDFCEKWKAGSAGERPEFLHALSLAKESNPWFVEANIVHALGQWGRALTRDALGAWLSAYAMDRPGKPKTVGIIMAGNVPLVGFHDFLAVLLSGHRVLAKLSSQDRHLMPFLAQRLVQAEPALGGRIAFVEGKMQGFDAVIATGSNNTGRYFEYYFGQGPHIIRKNRNSVAILDGSEDQGELGALGDDIFRYFGLGCRNVSKLYVPRDYDFDVFFKGIFPYGEVVDHFKYANNYDYNRAIFLMNTEVFLDNGFLLLRENPAFASPISVLHYEFYDSIKTLREELKTAKGQLQCIVSGSDFTGDVPFGRTQDPALWDYADGVDTLEFLLGL